MQPARWTVAAVVAVLLAAVPGVASLPAARPGLDRAVSARLPVGEPVAAVGEASAPTVLDAVVEPGGGAPEATPILPPPADLDGELAPVESPPPTYRGSGRPGEVYALVVGIDDYPGTRADLGFAVADAEAIDLALDGFGVPAENRVLLRDGQARREPLVEAIRALVERAGPGTKVVLAVAGHVRHLGGDTQAIVTADGGLLTDAELADLLRPAMADQMWILLATCFAGGFTEVLAPGRVLTGASDARSLAYESSTVRGSFLVHHLVREGWLHGRAGPSVQEAFAYAERAMRGTAGEGAVQLDHGDRPLVLGPMPAHWAPPADGLATASTTPASTPTTTTTTTPPPRPAPPPTVAPDRRPGGCVLLVLCRR